MTTATIQPSNFPGGQYNASPPSLSDQQQSVFQVDAAGNLKTTLSSGGATIGTVDIDQTTPGTTNGVDIKPLPAANDPFTKVTVNITTATTTHVVTATAAQTVRVYKVVLNFAGTQTLDVKGTGGTSLVGAAMSFGTGGGLVLDFDGAAWWTTIAGEGLDFVTTTTATVTGTVYYIKS